MSERSAHRSCLSASYTRTLVKNAAKIEPRHGGWIGSGPAAQSAVSRSTIESLTRAVQKHSCCGGQTCLASPVCMRRLDMPKRAPRSTVSPSRPRPGPSPGSSGVSQVTEATLTLSMLYFLYRIKLYASMCISRVMHGAICGWMVLRVSTPVCLAGPGHLRYATVSGTTR
jgi:hypothetical protein